MADQLSALDLEAELHEAQDNGYTPTAQMIVYLIQRLREAEAEVERRGDIADKALAGWGLDQADLFKAQARIRLLEQAHDEAVIALGEGDCVGALIILKDVVTSLGGPHP